MDDLDVPVRASLWSDQADLSEGNDLARRYRPDVNLFASARGDSTAALEALAGLVGPGEQVFMLQVPEIVVPDGLAVELAAPGVQMVLARPVDAPDRSGIEVLTAADAAGMHALATLTRPGPFLERTHLMGRFLGVRIDGRLAAMAGVRMRFPGHVEVSGVCTHPDFRGRGVGRRLSAAIAEDIAAGGSTPFLHAWASNETAISLYRSLGFELRREMNVAVLVRAE
ncbi:putative GNAT family acetyltransferase [Rhodobium orientis]|uniref:GNAT family N-acetyltransferase n=1 Tax=Rhodobium orientis TaxID=34017 RepID=A0A327JIR9_9HYPH|nr:GNAT family N-acetyltransferase [Rhodobium orientis]MBB4305513.1 putative GNAT family acetyltransferase [Rhodobium orientis]MBK5949848.1 GNAT family N-acetyltransferase [Rhodobium orientis]RAI24722.1 GNAT family N-acetyltransferase [Rhodobium orientis]